MNTAFYNQRSNLTTPLSGSGVLSGVSKITSSDLNPRILALNSSFALLRCSLDTLFATLAASSFSLTNSVSELDDWLLVVVVVVVELLEVLEVPDAPDELDDWDVEFIAESSAEEFDSIALVHTMDTLLN